MHGELQLVIPTHARPATQITLTQFPASMRKNILLVTSTAADAAAIRENYSHQNIVVAKGTTCIAEKRHWIMHNVRAPYVFMMDDDVVFARRCAAVHRVYENGSWQVHTPGVTFLQQATAADLPYAFNQVLKKFKAGYAGVGVGCRMHNDKQPDSWTCDTRMMYTFGLSVAVYKRLRLNFAEVFCREDFNITLRLLRAGEHNAVYQELVANPSAAFNAPGGASTERTLERSNAEAEKLASLHPGLVRVTEKAYKGSLNRKEVVIQWKQAAQQGAANAGIKHSRAR